jgi:hypothetical protein
LHASDAFGLDEFEVGISVLAEGAETRFPVGIAALSLGCGRREDGREN